jgi:hypothetical protein
MSFRLENTEKYLRQYAKSLLDSAISEIQRKDRVREYSTGNVTSPIEASGQLQESLKLIEKDTKSVLELNIEGNAYGEQIDEGTRSTSVSKDKLIQWIQNKNGFKDLSGKPVNLSNLKEVGRIAGLISKSLKFNGIKQTNFLTNIVESKFKELNNIEAPILKDANDDLDNILKRAGYKKGANETFSIQTKIIQ